MSQSAFVADVVVGTDLMSVLHGRNDWCIGANVWKIQL